MMTIDQDDLWLCTDCTLAAVNDDYTGLDYSLSEQESDARAKEIRAGLAELGPNLCSNSSEDEGEEEFSTRSCDCCGTSLAGRRSRFVTLAEVRCPFTAVAETNAGHARALAQAVASAHDDPYQVYACVRMARMLDLLPGGDYLGGPAFDPWTDHAHELDGDNLETLRDFAWTFLGVRDA